MIAKEKNRWKELDAGDLIFTLLWIAFVLVLFSQTLSFGRMARLVPMIVIVPTLALLIAVLILKLRSAHNHFLLKDGWQVFMKPNEAKIIGSKTSDPGRENARAKDEMAVIAWVGGLVALIHLIGFLAGIPLFAFGYLKLGSRERWSISIFTSIGLFLLFHLVFSVALDLHLYSGRLWGWLGI